MHEFDVRYLLLSLILIQGCSTPKSTATGGQQVSTQPKPVPEQQMETGRAALQKMYASARVWAGDAQPVSLESRARKGDMAGKAAIWVAAFASPAKRAVRNFMWSGATGEDAPERGISPGSIDIYSPDNVNTRPLDLTFLKVDSDQAFAVAQKHGGSDVLKKNPDLPVKYAVVWEAAQNRMLWRVTYGVSEISAKLNVQVNASLGTFMNAEK